MMTELTGKPISHAKPIHLTFYDQLLDWPYRTTFYVRDDAGDEDCHRLIEAICAVSICALGQYTIGYKEYVVPDYREKLNGPNRSYIMGTFKWRISVRDEKERLHAYTIPGWNADLSLHALSPGMRKKGDGAHRDHPLWQTFLATFTELCVTQEGEPMSGYIEVDRTASNWPPKGWKKRN